MSIVKGTNQIVAGFGGTKRSIGEVYFSQSSLATDNSGALPLFTGETITSANTIYPDFYNWVSAHTELQCTSEEYESALSTYGECPKYVIGGGSLRLPKLSNYIKVANPSEGIKNIEAGLPNITGSFGGLSHSTANGAFTEKKFISSLQGSSSGGGAVKNGFDASRSSSVYGKSDTVTPPSTTLYPWVVAYAAAIPASEAQAAEFQQGLSGKADTSLGNLSATGKSLASGLGMPSDKYIELTLGASGSSYTAPANGWFCLNGKDSDATGYFDFIMRNQTRYFGVAGTKNQMSSPAWSAYVLPAKRGDIIRYYYTGVIPFNNTNWYFRFYYAVGAK